MGKAAITPDPFQLWPPYVWRGALALFGGAAAIVLVQRRASLASILLVGLIVASAVIEHLLPARFCPAFSSVGAVAGVAGLLAHPAHADAAPFVLLLNSAFAAVVAPLGISIAIAAVSAAVPVTWNLVGRFDSSILWVAGIALGWMAGAIGRFLMQLLSELREAQAGLAVQAASDERRRIAREVHDVIAHSLTVTMLHVTGARMSLEANDPDDAAAALRDAEEHGRASLAEIRRTVGLLAEGDGPRGATAPPEPSASDIPELVASYAAAGLDVLLEITGDLATLSPTAGLNLYRIVQEGLANAVKHAPGAPARVEIVVGPETRLVIRNPAPANRSLPTDNGHGITGMHERAALLGGRLRAGRDGSDWLVEVTA